MCFHCFGGPHPFTTPPVLPQRKKLPTQSFPNIVVFISGSGTNLQQILDGVSKGEIRAQIQAVVSNTADAFGLVRAKRAGVTTKVFSSRGIFADPTARKRYEKTLIDYLKSMRPDVIVLAGWMIVLGKSFLLAMQNLGITIINLHPALLTEKSDDEMWTTRGKVPVIRGTHAIEKAYESSVPLSGVTVHQVLPGNGMDTGPIIVREEVWKQPRESLKNWERRIHEAEYRALPTALKRVLHVISHNIDASGGEFFW
jgi:phosphoribosylglycinamide formyltransferase-1